VLRKVTQKLEKGGGAWLEKIAPNKQTVQNLGGERDCYQSSCGYRM